MKLPDKFELHALSEFPYQRIRSICEVEKSQRPCSRSRNFYTYMFILLKNFDATAKSLVISTCGEWCKITVSTIWFGDVIMRRKKWNFYLMRKSARGIGVRPYSHDLDRNKYQERSESIFYVRGREERFSENFTLNFLNVGVIASHSCRIFFLATVDKYCESVYRKFKKNNKFFKRRGRKFLKIQAKVVHVAVKIGVTFHFLSTFFHLPKYNNVEKMKLADYAAKSIFTIRKILIKFNDVRNIRLPTVAHFKVQRLPYQFFLRK